VGVQGTHLSETRINTDLYRVYRVCGVKIKVLTRETAGLGALSPLIHAFSSQEFQIYPDHPVHPVQVSVYAGFGNQPTLYKTFSTLITLYKT
jgi:hypothetical protein